MSETNNIVDIIDDVYLEWNENINNYLLYIHIIDQTENNFLDKYINDGQLFINLKNTKFGFAVVEGENFMDIIISLDRLTIVKEKVDDEINLASEESFNIRIEFQPVSFSKDKEYIRSEINDIIIIEGTLNNKNEIIPTNSRNIMTIESLENNMLSLSFHSIKGITINEELYVVNCFISSYSGPEHSPMLVISGDLPKQIYQYLPLEDHIFNLDIDEETTKIKSINKPFLEYGIDTTGNNASSINLTGITFN